MINSNHYFALAVSAGIFIASVFAFVFIYNRIETQSEVTAGLYTQVAEAQAEENQAQSIIGTLANTQNERGTLGSFFVHDDETVGFIKQIEAVGSQSSSTVSIVTISDDDLSDAASGTTGSIHAHIDIKGTWPNAMRGFHLMENLPYAESIDNVRVEPISKQTWNIEFDLTVALIHQ